MDTVVEGAPLRSSALDGPLDDAFSSVAFAWPFRRYQGLALEAFERDRGQGSRSAYLVLPPGAGKTALGLEVARRLGQRTLVLCPNTAVQAQWVRQWQDFQPPSVLAAAESDLAAPITALTYQTLCSLDASSEDLHGQALALWQRALEADGLPLREAEQAITQLRQAKNGQFRAEVGRFRRRVRQMVMRGGTRTELLGLLHPNGRALIERAQALGPLTLVLDECHHLLEMWGYLVRALVEELGPETFVVGLTATPPDLLTGEQAVLYRSLFGHADFSVPTPAVVKEGDLAPYQELAYFVRPLEHELRFIAEQHERFEALLQKLLDPDFASRSFVQWVRQRAVERQTAEGAVVGWGVLERADPAFAQALLRFLVQYQLDLPPDVRIGERHRQPLTADDWVALLEHFCLEVLKPSPDPRDAVAWEAVRRALPSLGYILTAQGVRSHVSPVDRVLALSAAKGIATTEILRVEHRVLGRELRALVLCDYERAGTELAAKLRGVLDPQAGSASLLLQTLAGDPASDALHPVLLTGRTVACSRATLAHLAPWLEEQEPALRGALETRALVNEASGRPTAWDDVVVLEPRVPDWRPRRYVPLLTQAFEEGVVQCLVGTRGLLGEGWDARRVNVLVDLTAAATSTSVHQMRGRSLRLDPRLPRKVADNWDVVCVDPAHPKGAADYRRFVRKHERYFAPTSEGAIESGVSHVHHALSPFAPPSAGLFAALNAGMLERAHDRDGAYERWAVGQPYQSTETATVRLLFGQPPGLPSRRLIRRAGVVALEREPSVPRANGVALAAGGLLGLVLLTTLGPWWAISLGVGVAILVRLGLLLVVARWRAQQPPRTQTDTLEMFAAALLEALRETGQVRRELGLDSLRVVAEDDGYYRCFIAGATMEESTLFADALDELLGPLESPRYIISREVRGVEPVGRADLRGDGAGKGPPLVYHAVPACLARTRGAARAFETAWNRYVSPGRVVRADDPAAQGILELVRGENPFAVTTQLRTLWT